MSPYEVMQEWQEIQREMKEGTPFAKEFDPEKDWFLQLCNGSSPQKSSRISSIIQYFSQLHGSSIVSMWPLKIPQPVLT